MCVYIYIYIQGVICEKNREGGGVGAFENF